MNPDVIYGSEKDSTISDAITDLVKNLRQEDATIAVITIKSIERLVTGIHFKADLMTLRGIKVFGAEFTVPDRKPAPAAPVFTVEDTREGGMRFNITGNAPGYDIYARETITGSPKLIAANVQTGWVDREPGKGRIYQVSTTTRTDNFVFEYTYLAQKDEPLGESFLHTRKPSSAQSYRIAIKIDNQGKYVSAQRELLNQDGSVAQVQMVDNIRLLDADRFDAWNFQYGHFESNYDLNEVYLGTRGNKTLVGRMSEIFAGDGRTRMFDYRYHYLNLGRDWENQGIWEIRYFDAQGNPTQVRQYYMEPEPLKGWKLFVYPPSLAQTLNKSQADVDTLLDSLRRDAYARNPETGYLEIKEVRKTPSGYILTLNVYNKNKEVEVYEYTLDKNGNRVGIHFPQGGYEYYFTPGKNLETTIKLDENREVISAVRADMEYAFLGDNYYVWVNDYGRFTWSNTKPETLEDFQAILGEIEGRYLLGFLLRERNASSTHLFSEITYTEAYTDEKRFQDGNVTRHYKNGPIAALDASDFAAMTAAPNGAAILKAAVEAQAKKFPAPWRHFFWVDYRFDAASGKSSVNIPNHEIDREYQYEFDTQGKLIQLFMSKSWTYREYKPGYIFTDTIHYYNERGLIRIETYYSPDEENPTTGKRGGLKSSQDF